MKTSLIKLQKKRRKILPRMSSKDLEILQETEKEVGIALAIIDVFFRRAWGAFCPTLMFEITRTLVKS